MKASRSVWSQSSGWTHEVGGAAVGEVDLALVFGSTGPMIASRLPEIRARYPNAYVCGGSTAGEIVGKEVRDDSGTPCTLQNQSMSVTLFSEI